jgi:ATP-binding cassette subfamily B protein
MDYLKEVIQKNKILVYIYLALGIVLAFLNNFSAKYFQQLIDNFSDGTLTIEIIVLYGMVLLILCISNYLEEYPGCKLKQEIYLDLKLKALQKISKIDYQKYQTMGTGKLVLRIENGASAGKNILSLSSE